MLPWTVSVKIPAASCAILFTLSFFGGVKAQPPSLELKSVSPDVEFVESPCPDHIMSGWCGVAMVPLDYGDADGETIEAGFAYFPPKTKIRKPLKVLQVVSGGPGDPVTQYMNAAMVETMRSMAPLHGVLAVDQRGSGLSTHLTCAANKGGYNVDSGEFYSACAKEMGARRVHFSTANIVRDFNLIRRGLGAEQVDILAFSYGTKLAPVYASMFPDAVRTLTLDGATPILERPDFNLEFLAAARRLFGAYCVRSDACAGDDAWAALGWAVETLRSAPRPLPIPDDGEARRSITELTPELLAELVAMRSVGIGGGAFSATAYAFPVIGALLDARDKGDWSALETIAINRIGDRFKNYSPDARQSVPLMTQLSCSELAAPWSFDMDVDARIAAWRTAATKLPAEATAPFTPEEWGMNTSYQFQYHACINWPRPPDGFTPEVPHDYAEGRKDLPVLIINGDLDMQTPNEGAHAVAARFSQAQFARFKYFSHAISPFSLCSVSLVRMFLEKKRVDDPDKCLEADSKRLYIRIPHENE